MRFWTTILHKEILHDFFKNVITLLSKSNRTLFDIQSKDPWTDNGKIEPGGCLQWVDLDPASAEVLRLDSDKSSGETEKVAALMRLSGVGRLYE